MYYWPLMSAFIGIGMSQFFLFMVAFLSWYRFLWPEQKQALIRTFLQISNNESQLNSAPTVESNDTPGLFN